MTTERHPLDTLNARDLAALRTIIAEVIADGPWEFTVGRHHVVGNNEQWQRLNFIEMVLGRVIAAATPATRREVTNANVD